MTDRILLGMLTPSSNTRLEPITAAMLAEIPEASAHFGRFRVTEIALSDAALAQFDDREILRAAELLSDAKVQTIGWNGTSAGWLGFESDERLCRRITEATGIPACTSVLALNEIFRLTGVKRFGLVTPYRDDVQAKIIVNYAAAGFECVAERHLGWQDNWSFSTATPDRAARDDPRSGESAARRDHFPLHRAAERAAGRGARARDRHSDVRHDRDRSLEVAEARRRRSETDQALGTALPRRRMRNRETT